MLRPPGGMVTAACDLLKLTGAERLLSTYALRFLISAITAGRTALKSATAPKWEISNIGEAALWLMLTTHLEFCIPTWYWTEPEIATLMIMSGLTVVPDWPRAHRRSAGLSFPAGLQTQTRHKLSSDFCRCLIYATFFVERSFTKNLAMLVKKP